MSTLASPALSNYIAQQVIAKQTVVFDEIIFCNIGNLSEQTLANHLTMPPESQIVHRQAISQAGVVNQNAVVYSVTMGTEIGDFDFNYIALINRQLNLLAVAVYTDTIKKIKNKNSVQGNAITRSILLEFDNAKQLTNISIPAKTWQIDFTLRLSGMDEKMRLANRDIYGRAEFFDEGFLVKRKTATQFSIQPGLAYIEGVRASIDSVQHISVSPPCSIYLDIVHHCTVTGAYQTEIKFLTSQQSDYVDSAGHQHYVQKLAEIAYNGKVTDRRLQKEKFHLDISHAVNSTSQTSVASSAAVKTAYDKGVEAKTAAEGAKQTADNAFNKGVEAKTAAEGAKQTADNALSVATGKQSPATTLSGYGITNFKIEQSSANANELKTDGHYYVTRSQNLPDNSAWHLDVISGGNSNAVRQIARKANDTQIKTRFFNGRSWSAWKNVGGDSLPVGAVMAFPKQISSPAGFLLANGGSFVPSQYPELYRALGNKNRLPNLHRSDVGMTAYFAVDEIPDGWIAFDRIRSTVTRSEYPELYQHLVAKYRNIRSVPLVEDRFIRNASGLSVGEIQAGSLIGIDSTDAAAAFSPYINSIGYSYRDSANKVGVDGLNATEISRYDGGLTWVTSNVKGSNNILKNQATNPNREGHLIGTARPKSIALKLCIKAENSFGGIKFWIKAA